MQIFAKITHRLSPLLGIPFFLFACFGKKITFKVSQSSCRASSSKLLVRGMKALSLN